MAVDDPGPQEINPDTLEFMWSATKEAPERQLESARAADTKMVQIFAAASIVIGLAGFATGGAVSDRAVGSLIAAALAAYIFSAFFAFLHLRTRRFRRSLQADVMWTEHWQDEVLDIKHSLVADISSAYRHNKQLLENKARFSLAALVATGLEVVLVGAALTKSVLVA